MSDKNAKTTPVWSDAFTLPRFIVLLALLIFAEYPEVVLGSHSFFYKDFGLFTYPVAHYTHECFWRGEIPLWNAFNNCGTPFLAQWNTTVCYPLSCLYVLLPLPWSLNYFCLGHLLIAGVAMYCLALRWTKNRFAASVAGLVFALNGLTINCVMWTSNLAALAWMPLVLLCVERAWTEGRRWIPLAALVGATQMLAGAPEIILLTWLLAATLFCGAVLKRGRGKVEGLASRFLFVVIMVAGMCAVQLLPFFELLQNTQRPTVDASAWAMPLRGLANLLVPLFHSTPSLAGVWSQDDQQWTSSYYLGVGMLGLALAAVLVRESRVRWLVFIALLGVVLALGENTYVYSWVRRAIPSLGLARYPIKFVVLTVFALPLLAAFAVSQVTQPEAKDLKRVRRGMLWWGAILMITITGLLIYELVRPFQEALHGTVLLNGLVRIGFLITTVTGVFLLHRVVQLRVRSALASGILVLIGADLLTHTPRQNPVVANEVYLGASPVTMSPKPVLGRSRAMLSQFAQAWLGNAATSDPVEYVRGWRSALYGDCNLLDDIPKVNGFYSLYLRDFVTVRNAIYEPTNFTPGLADFLGVEQITAPGELFNWRTRQTCLPLVTSGQQIVFTNAAETLRAITAPSFEPRRTVYLPEEVRNQVAATNGTAAEIVASSYAPHRIELKVRADEAALIVLAQSFYPCWHARVDGEPVGLLRANAAFQAVEVPAGEHVVSLAYKDRMFSWGLVISLVFWLVCLLSLVDQRGPARKAVLVGFGPTESRPAKSTSPPPS